MDALRDWQMTMNVPQHSLVWDLSTWWNSTSFMFEQLLEQQWAIYAVIHDAKVTNSDKRHLDLKAEQWDVLSQLVVVLKSLQIATTALCNDLNLSCSMIHPVINSLIKCHLALKEDDLTAVKQFKKLVVLSCSIGLNLIPTEYQFWLQLWTHAFISWSSLMLSKGMKNLVFFKRKFKFCMMVKTLRNHVNLRASIPYSQVLRLQWICSEEENLRKRTHDLKEHFLKRGYDEQHLNIELRRVLHTTRETCLQTKQSQDKSARIPLMVTYHHSLPSFHSTTKRHLPNLHASERIREAFRLPPLIAFRHPRNLKDFLVRVALTSTPREPPGNYPCGVPRSKTCPILVASDEFSSHATGKSYKVKTRASCKSSNVIYLITCRRCGQQYAGETSQPFHLRVNGHKYDIAHRRTDKSPVSKYFNSGTHTLVDMSVMVIKCACSQDPCLRRIRESKWIMTLGTSFPQGR